MFILKRSQLNPILTPSSEHFWEASATFNPSPIKIGRKINLIYRAISAPDVLSNPHQVSTIGVAEYSNEKECINHKQFIQPVMEWEKFGCEDPRVTYFEGKYYTFYTAISKFPFEAKGIKCAVAVSKDLKTVNERHLVTPFNAKAMCLFPERINGKIVVIFSAHTDEPPSKMSIKEFNKIEDIWSENSWSNFESEIDKFTLDPRRKETDHTEIGAVPIKTKYGWLLIYSHIENYFNQNERVFGIEALLLDLKDPKKIIGRTKGPMLVPEEPYELEGQVSRIVFPSGALVVGDDLNIYYGAADSSGCKATVSFTDLIYSLYLDTAPNWHLKRFDKNPIITPNKDHSWEEKATLNPGVLKIKNIIYIFYRAISSDNTSTVGLATTKNGYNILSRLANPIYTPRTHYEMKKVEGGNSGCEDPRIIKIGERIYMFYTAFDGIGPPKVAATSINEKDFINQNFCWTEPELITPLNVDDKDACILPEKINNKYFVLHRIGTDICGDFLQSLDFNKHKVTKCIKIIGPRSGMWDSVKVGIAGPPIKTKKGWLLLYHGISKEKHKYRIGAILLDLKDPTMVLARSTDPIFEPEEEYEKVGIVNNVVFPCGMVELGNLLFVYYGGADTVVGVATIETKILLNSLTRKYISKG